MSKVLKGGDERTSLMMAGLEVPNVEIDPKAPKRAIEDLKKRLQKLPKQPIAVYYTTKRFFNESFKSIPKSPPFSMLRAYSNALEDLDVSLRDFAHWFHFASRNKQGNRIANQMTEVISEFIPKFRNLRLTEQGPLQFLVDKGGITLPLTNLSDGERGLLAMVFDLTRRLSLANPSSDDPVREGEGIVLIDEIELHLHPKWQRKVLGGLSRAFKKCQFIVTTHSPQILGELDASKIRVIEAGKAYQPLRSFGMDSSRVLEEIMDAEPRNKSVSDKLRKLAIAVEKGDLPAASKSLKLLRRQLGESAPEVLEAETMLHFLGDK